MKPVRYLDANVFLYAALDDGPDGEAAGELLLDLGRGENDAVTASLTLDEVLWVIQQEDERQRAIQQAQRLLALPHLRILDVTADDLLQATHHMEAHEPLDPRDAIHAAVALQHGVYTIVSRDADFDHVPQLTREWVV